MASARKKVAASTPEDNEAYWHGNGFTPFNFNDDEEDDSIDVIRWDGSNAASVKPKAQSSTNVRPVSQPISARPASARYTPRKPNFPPSPASLPNTEVRPKPDTRTIAEVVNEKAPPTATELVKLETEIQTLRRKLAQAKRDQAAAPSKSETLRRIMVSEPYVLELYKSKEDKASLLDSAIERQDGNAILAATLFMRDTLKRDLFSKELMQRQVAVDHYCAYLRAAGEIDELHETLSALGRTEEAAMLKYKQCLASTTATTPEIRASGLKDCVK
uniref:Spermatogenesis-defective protein 39 homolog n=1 Tax=Ciona savignyi TaxID=51511 RepID=H2ZPI9_CIOSA